MIVAPLAQSVPIAHGPDGYCKGSPMSIHDSFPGKNGALEDIVGMATVSLAGDVVGWVYRTRSGHFYAQANQKMPASDQRSARTIVKPAGSRYGGPRFISGIMPIGNNPWNNLRIKNCSKADFSKRTY